jgi:large subunit ribosomal protein L35Ae
MEAKILNFRGGLHTKYDNQMILEIKGVDNKDKTQKIIGKTITWTSPSGKHINGKISNAHGNKGIVRAIFERGMPGQAIGTKVEVK